MSYVKHILQPGEDVLVVGHLHWIIYWHALVWFLACAVAGAVAVHYHETNYRWLTAVAVAALLFLFGFVALIRAWWHAFTTEIAVTTHRVIYKRGFFNRHTEEMNVDKIASVDVDQPILGRILGYGSINIRGTGGDIEKLDRIAHPIELRNAITSR